MPLGINAPETRSVFEYESILFESERMRNTVELKGVVTDFSLWEHIEKPYLTAEIYFLDGQNFFTNADILGGEKITVRLKSLEETATAIEKKFYIDKVLFNTKGNDNVEAIGLHLIEDIGYIANLLNVNQSYSGTCTHIIKKIAEGHLGKEVLTTDNDDQLIKVIVPNLNPLEAMVWIKNRATTVEGFPFYLFSSFTGKKLSFADLISMISQPAINLGQPFTYIQGSSQSDDASEVRRTIRQYEQENTENLFSLISQGSVGAKYQYINTTKNKTNEFHFDVAKDVFRVLFDNNYLPKQQNKVMYSDLYKHNEQEFHEYDSRVISHIGGALAFDNNDSPTVKSYNESDEIANYKQNAISKAMNKFLKKAPMMITVNGDDFLRGDANPTIGNNISILFKNSKTDKDRSESGVDHKKSGDFMIFGAEHAFKKSGDYTIRLSCVKLADLSRM